MRHRVVVLLMFVIIAGFAFGDVRDVSADVYKSQIRPHWSADGTHFWYRNDLAERRREYMLVDLRKGTRQQAFDHARFAMALKQAGAGDPAPDRLLLDKLSFDLAANTVTFRTTGREYRCDLKSYVVTEYREPVVAPRPFSQRKEAASEQQVDTKPYRPSRDVSPDGKWRAYIQEHNLYIKSTTDEEQIQLSTDGGEGNSYQTPYWAPNSNNLIAFRVEPGKIGEVHMVESSPKQGGRAKLHTRRYALPGDPFTIQELNWFDITQRTQAKPEGGRIDFHGPRLRWTPDGRHVRFEKVDRGHQRFRVVELDTFTGQPRNIIDEVSETFIWTQHYQNLGIGLVHWLENRKELIYRSERDGWRHLYLVDIATGKLKPITSGEYVVRRVDKIDQEKRQIWFRASGRNKNQNPYLIHYYRINFDGTGLVALTEGNGTHSVQYSPDRMFLIDSYSRVDQPPIHELRRVTDGTLVCPLETTDISELIASGWQPPEVFTAKGRDGKTDIWGIICKPSQFDPAKKYPVVEHIYAGPHDSHVPWQFRASHWYSNYTDIGMVVVKIDGMGTANRSKAFHDVCWKNLKDAGFPDRILWHKAVAKKHAWYDTTRVGIYGRSAGGQNAMGALLFHNDFYKVAVASCGCHDNRMDKASWNEQWMGYPVGPHYAASSNVDHAHKLKGKLMLIVGELDTNVPPESTMRVVDALIKANKHFDFVFIPGAGHGIGRYGAQRQDAFLKKHLLDEPVQ